MVLSQPLKREAGQGCTCGPGDGAKHAGAQRGDRDARRKLQRAKGEFVTAFEGAEPGRKRRKRGARGHGSAVTTSSVEQIYREQT